MPFGLSKNKHKPTGDAKVAGDLAIRPYRKPARSDRLAHDRKDFEKKLKQLATGYTSKKTLLDYEIDRTLGTGSFGRVLLVKAKGVKEFRACKIISKERIIKTRQVEHTINEKNILFCINNRFIVSLFDYMMDKCNLYFILEFVNGGEMFTLIQKQPKRRLSPEVTRFFSAEAVLAFEYMHNLDIVFRDLKPENLLIDSKGHLRVTDFGFAKRVEDKTWTMCGTPEYLAPEIIVNKGYNHAVDWWAIGVLTYEMRCGRSPFEARSQMDMFKKITKRDFKYPRDFTEDEQAYIGGLLQVDLTRRLGNMHGGVEDIRKQPYFRGINWDKLAAGSVPSPFASFVKVKNEADASNFEKYPEEPVKWYGDGADKFGDTFAHF
eukprot:m.12877 g.12877  ORF g.12877 m.12877 type:complete len:377 (+) comp4384_c0_seq1:322-1452(+)